MPVSFKCSCPDWAAMCKHVAAALYGVGARLDGEPVLFFRLRQVDETELLTAAGSGATLAGASGKRKRIAESKLADVFGTPAGTRVHAGGRYGVLTGRESPPTLAPFAPWTRTRP